MRVFLTVGHESVLVLNYVFDYLLIQEIRPGQECSHQEWKIWILRVRR